MIKSFTLELRGLKCNKSSDGLYNLWAYGVYPELGFYVSRQQLKKPLRFKKGVPHMKKFYDKGI